LNDFGKVDALLNNAGYGLMGALEHATTEQIRYQFDVNVFGLLDVTRAFLPHFRENKEGVILNVSSVGGRVAFPFISLYHSTKWAVEGLTESLSYELGELNIRAKIIEPGAINTDFGGRSMVFAQSDSIRDYDEALAKMTKAMSELATNQASEPELVAEVIYEAATDGKNQLRYRAGADCEEWLNQREAAGDDQFIATIKQQIFGS
jgi:NAD(P)-dependent dehydrogenase (short-subunit alcohol dehydrogenase family)